MTDTEMSEISNDDLPDPTPTTDGDPCKSDHEDGEGGNDPSTNTQKDEACENESPDVDSGKKATEDKKSTLMFRRALKEAAFPLDIHKAFDKNATHDDGSSSTSSSSSSSSTSLSSSWSKHDDDLVRPDDPSTWAVDITSHIMPEYVEDDSPSRREWLRMKVENKEENPALDQLMSMVGLEEVKAHFLAVKRRVEAAANSGGPRNGQDNDLGLHLMMFGNDGTGKNMIAKLYAQFLVYIGAVPRDSECVSCTLPSDSQARDSMKQRTTPKLRQASVVYWTSASSWRFPLRRGLKRVKSGVNPPVMIVAARGESMIKTIQENPDAPSCFQSPIELPDYSEEELLKLLTRIEAREGIVFEEESAAVCRQIIARRVYGTRDSDDYDNIHGLRKELQKICRRKDLRIQKEYTEWFREGSGATLFQPRRELTLDDVLGDSPKDVRTTSKAWKKLQEMVGLDTIKAECEEIIKFAQINHQMRQLGREPIKVGLNRTFLGPPGVGKTTVAKLYGQLLVDLSLVSGDEVMVRNPTDLIGAYIGHSEENTKKILNEAKGKVLIIDDAHALHPGDKGGGHRTDVFRTAVIETIVAEVSADPEDRCVILVGYEEEMDQMFLNTNKGLQRRFPKESAVRFRSYNEDELCLILESSIKVAGFSLSEQAQVVARQTLSRMSINPRFGNAGDVENLLNQAKIRCMKDTTFGVSNMESNSESMFLLRPHHFDPEWDRLAKAGDRRSGLFAGMVGFERIIKQFEGYELLVSGLRSHDIDPRPHIPWSFTFVGPPGTGKTTTARKIGQLYYDLSLLSSSEVVTCSASDLVGEYVGQTGPKVRRVLETALGKVLFIDEAYRLVGGSHSFTAEAVGELVDAMTQKRYLNNMVIILAGYSDEMEALMRTNPGLRSRFLQRVAFPHMRPRAGLTHLANTLKKSNITLVFPSGAEASQDGKVHRLLRKLSETKGWANARDIETLSRKVLGAVYMLQGKVGSTGNADLLRVTLEDLEPFLMDMLKERKSYQDDDE